MQAQVGSLFSRVDPRVNRRTTLVGMILLLVVIVYLALSYVLALFRSPLQFTQFSGATPAALSVMAGPGDMVTYQLTLRNRSVIPIRVTGVEAVPRQPLSPVGVQVIPDEGGTPEPFRPFTLAPLESVYLLVTSPAVCGARQNSLRLRYSMLGSGRTSDLSFGGPITVATFRCPWVGL